MEAQPRDDLFQRSNLTRGQLLLWTGQQLHPRTPLYNMAFRFDFRGRIDPRAFRQAFVQLVAESDALRTVVENRAGVPWQVVRPRLDTALSIIDLSTLDDPATVCRELAQASCERPFDLERRLFDAALYRLGDERYAWSFSQHHLVTDAWSVTVLFRRLAELYGGLATGESPDVALLADFQAAVADQRASPTDRETADHWRQQAAHTSQPARLYGQPPAGRSTASERLACDLDEHRSEALVALARRPEARALTLDSSLFNLLATVLLAYLHRISGQTILAVGAPTHNRTSAALRRTAGLLTEVFPLTVEIEPGASFLDLLRAVQRQSQAFLRFARAGASNARQNRGISAVLNFIRGSFDDFDGTPVTAEWLHPRHHDREHALRLHVHDFDGSGRPNLLFDFRCDVFDARRRSEAPGHFSSLLDALLEDWQQPIATVDLLSATEVRRQMVELHPERRAHGTRDSLAQRLARTIEQRPEATALRCGEEHLTYRTLDRLAERLAAKSRRLAAKSRHDTLGDEPIIGLCMQRSTEAFVAILALHRAGTAYLPIDPAWPAERIALVIADAGLSLILTQPMTDGPVRHHARTLQVELQALHSEEGDLGPTTGPEPSPAAEAYRLYTSGSTGRPKAVVVSRGALTHYVTWASAHYCADAPHNLPLFSPLTFDLTVTSIYLPLVTGGTVVIYPETGRRVDLALLDVVAQNSVDLIKLTPSHLGLLQSNAKGGAQGRSRVRQLIFGGEALNREAALRAVAHFGDAVRIDNEYGPTEATVGCIVHSFDRQADRLDVPIGRPIRGMQAYVLDRMLQPLPEGIVGELYLAGDGLARGYAGRPAHTAERFLPHPFEHGQRLYRSGDLARFGRDPDGRLRLEYLGRGDEQVKIRGARIEPGEIEAVLAQHPQLEDCVVLKLDDAPTARADARLCSRCGLPSTYPQTDLDTAGVCNHCRAFDTYEPRLRRYFGTLDDLRAILDGARDAPTYDCMALYSGGKDSTYALCQLVDMGYRVLAFTLDNGFISEQAKTNILRVVQALGVDHVFGSTPAMNRIFADSLERHANVCQGCFKTIYTLSTQLAQQKGIPFIVTGLSRGQLFETRLTEDLFSGPDLDSERIDQMVLAARKAYHRTDDAVSRLLDVALFADDAIFDQVRFVDFYRYCAVGLGEMFAELARRVPWVRPTDTGRSTNCLINDAGIFVHAKRRGFHNYAWPYSWDVRLGHKERRAALEELDDDIDPMQVQQILDEVGYSLDAGGGGRLTAYYAADREIEADELRRFVADQLPEYMVPSHFLRLASLPTNAHGKLDREALPRPDGERPASSAPFLASRSPIEKTLARIWVDVLGLDRVGIRDPFIALGGDSITALRIVARCHRAGLELTAEELFDHPTIEQLATCCRVPRSAAETTVPATASRTSSGPLPLTPAQSWFFDHQPFPEQWNHVVHLDLPATVDRAALARALGRLSGRHEALRARFRRDAAGTWQTSLAASVPPPDLWVIDTSHLAEAEGARTEAAAEAALHASLDLERPPLLAAALLRRADRDRRLILVAHHLLVDAVSWSILLADLAATWQRSEDSLSAPPQGSAGLATWSRAAAAWVDSPAAGEELAYWRGVLEPPATPMRPDQITADSSTAPRQAVETVSVRLDGPATETLVRQVPAAGHLRTHEILVAALGSTLAERVGNRQISFFLERHGREALQPGLDATQVVGWLTSLFPVRLDLPGEPGALLRVTKDHLRQVPRGGIGYGWLRYASSDHAVRRELATLEARDPHPVVFNYLGEAEGLGPSDGPFRLAKPLALSRGPKAHCPFALEVVAMLQRGRLEVDWIFDRQTFRRGTVQRLASAFLQHLHDLLEHCLADRQSGRSASDFPLANLDEAKLGKLAAVLRRGQT